MLFAVHISDGILSLPWSVGGFLLAALLLCVATYRLRDEEIPRVALLTAAFFIASSIHVRVGPTSVHLLLNGLVGVLLGWRAGLSIAIGLALQYVLLAHGGYQTLGINTCILTLPALLCYGLFRGLHRLSWLRAPWGRGALVGCAALLWFFGAAYSVSLLKVAAWDGESLNWTTLHIHPALIPVGLVFAGAAIWGEKRLENAPEFPLGLLVGMLAVLLTVGLNATVLVLAGEEEWRVPTLILVLLHLPVAIVEAIILGFAVGFLARVKPAMLGFGANGTPRADRDGLVMALPIPGLRPGAKREDVVE